jgi:hypothetical protein
MRMKPSIKKLRSGQELTRLLSLLRTVVEATVSRKEIFRFQKRLGLDDTKPVAI